MPSHTSRIFVAALVLSASLGVQNPLSPESTANWNRLYSSEAASTSFLQNNWNKYSENYHPNYVLDDRPETAWVEGVEGQGEQQHIVWRISPLSTARAVKLSIRNGYQKSKALFAKNSMPKDVIVSLHAPGMQTVAEQKFTLQKQWGFQDVSLSIPEERGFAFVKVTVLSVYPGSTYADTCVSDIRTFVDSKVAYNADVELGKKKQLDGWVKERFRTAKYFAALPKEYPFASTHYESGKREVKVSARELDARVDAYEKILERVSRTPSVYRVVHTTRYEAPDGLFEFRDLRNFVNLDPVAFFELKNDPGMQEGSGYRDDAGEYFFSSYRLEKFPGSDAVRFVTFDVRVAYNERTLYITHSNILFEYDASGRLMAVFVREKVESDMGAPAMNYKVSTVARNKAGQVQRIQQQSRWERDKDGGEATYSGTLYEAVTK